MTILSAFDYESITLDNATKSLTSATLEGSGVPAQRVLITVETNSIRFRHDGTDPTSSEGHVVAVDNSLVIVGARDLRRLKMISTDAGGSTVKVSYEREAA